MPTRRAVIAGGGALVLAALPRGLEAKTKRTKPLVFGHRGASALRPEHTLASYAKAIADGADVIESDLVATRDGVLVARHENNVAETTDVASRPEFAARRTTRTIDGQPQTGWFTEDFTLTELKTLCAIERLGAVRPESRGYDGQFQILTLDEIIDFTAAESAARGRDVGLAPELKHSTYFASIGLPLEDRFLAVLAAHRYSMRAPIFVQSFETKNLRSIRKRLGRTTNVQLVQLVGEDVAHPAYDPDTTYADMTTAKGLRMIAGYADVIGPPTRRIIPLRADGALDAPTSIVTDAQAAGLRVVPWTFRPENRFLAADFRGGKEANARAAAGSVAEIRRYIATGIDGFFTDDPALGRRAVDER